MVDQSGTDQSAVTGLVVVQVYGPDGRCRVRHEVRNLITDIGDEYHASRIAAGVGPAAPGDVATVTGMKLGTGTDAADKNGSGAQLGSYLPGAHVGFADGSPSVQSLGPGLGCTVTYLAVFGPGVATHAALTEAVIVTDSGVNATSGAEATISRMVFPATAKETIETLTVSWAHKQLGS